MPLIHGVGITRSWFGLIATGVVGSNCSVLGAWFIRDVCIIGVLV